MITVINSTIDYSASSAAYDLGTLYFAGTKAYRYVRAAAACTNDLLASTESVCGDSGGVYYVNNDLAGGTGLGVTTPMGVAIGTIAENYYGWIQVGGVATVITDGEVAAAEAIVLDASNDGDVDTMADGEEEQVFGWATAADVGTVGTIMLRGLI